MFWNVLLDDAAQTTGTPQGGSNWVFFVLLLLLVALFVAWFLFSGRKNKQRQKEYLEQLEALGPGHKVKTIGGICGIVVEVCDDNTVVIETGTEASGRSYLKIDKECIAQTDAKGPSQRAREEAEAKRRAEREAKNPDRAPVAVEQPEEPFEAQPEATSPEEEPEELEAKQAVPEEEPAPEVFEEPAELEEPEATEEPEEPAQF